EEATRLQGKRQHLRNLGVVHFHDRGLNQDLKTLRAADVQRSYRILPRIWPATEMVVLCRLERIDADRHTSDTAFDHLFDDLVGDQNAIGAHHHPGPLARRIPCDLLEVI